MSNEDTTRQFSTEGGGQGQPGRTLDDLFRLVEALAGEFTEFRGRVETRLLNTTPLSETLEAVRADVRGVAEQQDTLAREVAEIAKAARRIESKVNGISIDFSEMKGILQNHEERLQALNSQ